VGTSLGDVLGDGTAVVGDGTWVAVLGAGVGDGDGAAVGRVTGEHAARIIANAVAAEPILEPGRCRSAARVAIDTGLLPRGGTVALMAGSQGESYAGPALTIWCSPGPEHQPR